MRIGSFFGVPLYVSPSWLLITAFITVFFADLFRTSVTGASGATPYLLALAFAILSAVCVLVHELGHVAAALLLGLSVRRVSIFLIGGITEIEPEPERARQEFAISVAGPLTSAAIAGLAWLGSLATTRGTAIAVELEVLIWSNLIIAVFNALPGLPLDGGRALRAVIWAGSRSRVRATRIAAWAGRVLALGVAVSGLFVQRGGWGIVSALITAAMGAFLWIGASQSLTAARVSGSLPLLRLADLVRPAIWVPAETSVAEALRRLWQSGSRAIVVVDAGATPRAIVAEAQVEALPADEHPWTPVGALAAPIDAATTLAVGLTGTDLLRAVGDHPASEHLVVDELGHPLGVLTARDLRAALVQARDPHGAMT